MTTQPTRGMTEAEWQEGNRLIAAFNAADIDSEEFVQSGHKLRDWVMDNAPALVDAARRASLADAVVEAARWKYERPLSVGAANALGAALSAYDAALVTPARTGDEHGK